VIARRAPRQPGREGSAAGYRHRSCALAPGWQPANLPLRVR